MMSDEERGMEEDLADETTRADDVQDEDDRPSKVTKTAVKNMKDTVRSCIKPGPGEITDPVNSSDNQGQDSPGTSPAGGEPVTVYPYTKRGHAVFVCNKFENDPTQITRDGADKDFDNLENIFVKKLGFQKVHKDKEYYDLTKSEMKKELVRVVKEHTEDCDCFVFAISSHGMEMVNPNKNGEIDAAVLFATPSNQSYSSTSKVESGEYMMFLTDIIDMFSEKNCANLKGKPKIFLFQCCRSREDKPVAEMLDDGVKMMYEQSDKLTGHHGASDTTGGKSQTDTPGTSEVSGRGKGVNFDADDSAGTADQSRDVADAGHQADPTPEPKKFTSDGSLAYCFHDDCLVMAAVPPKKFAWRSTTEGSWMIYFLNKAIEESGEMINFLQVFTRTSQLMAEKTTTVYEYEKNKFGEYVKDISGDKIIKCDKSGNRIESEMSGKKAVPVIEHTLTKDILIKKIN